MISLLGKRYAFTYQDYMTMAYNVFKPLHDKAVKELQTEQKNMNKNMPNLK